MNLQLRKFDIAQIKSDKVCVFIGKRETGKSYLVKDLLYYHQDIPIGTVISGTEAGNGFYAQHVPKLFIHEEYNTAIIENILKRQRARHTPSDPSDSSKAWQPWSTICVCQRA